MQTEREKLEARVEEIQAQIRCLAMRPFSEDWEEACAEREAVAVLEDELREKTRMLAKFFPPEPDAEDEEFWKAQTPMLC